MIKDEFRNEMEFSAGKILKLFKKNKKTFFWVTGIIFSTSVLVFLFFLKPQFEVLSTVEIRGTSQTPISMDDPMSFLLSSAAGQNTSIDMDILKSRKVMNMVINKMNLQMDVSKGRNNMFMYFLNKIRGVPENNAFVVFKSFPDSFMSGSGEIEAELTGYSIFKDGKKFDCKWSEPCHSDNGDVVLENIGDFSDIRTKFNFSFRNIIDTRDIFTSSLLIVPSEESPLITISFIHPSSEMAALFVRNIIESYKELKSSWNKDDEQVKMLYIKGILDKLQNDIDLKSQKMILFQKERDTLIPEIQVEEMIKKKEQMKIQLDEINLKYDLMQESLKSLERKPDAPVIATALYNDLSFQRALQGHNELVFKKNELMKTMTPQHPMVVASEDEIEKSAQSLILMFRESINTIDKSREIVRKLISYMETDQKKLPENLYMFAELKRDIELAETVFVTLSAKLYQTSIDPSTGLSPIRIIDDPDPVVAKSSPKTSIFIIFLLFFTLLSGVFAVFIKDFFFTKVENEGDNEKS